ncbi:MAG TPA: energy transducer TonB [Candidatus Sulfotelmatobacter sp.]|nr:energy transducer TonB [Candidatus Sulfotelmatobacter sp.]
MRIAAAVLVVACALGLGVAAADENDDFLKLIERAAKTSNLMADGAAPFHMKLVAQSNRKDHPEYATEIEWWWSSAEKWRREVKTPGFTQTAVRNGTQYYESNSSEYLPWWLHELIAATTDPVPLEELRRADMDVHGACGKWESEYAKDGEKIGVSNQACVNPDGTVGQLFTRTLGAEFGNYQSFGGKRVAGTVKVWAVSPNEVTGTVTVLEKLKDADEKFQVVNDIGFGARVRFVSVAGDAVQLDQEKSRAVEWPVVHSFPAKGVMAVQVKLDREGNVREVGTIVSSNVALTDAAKQQIGQWKFKPYLQDGFPVEVNTTIAVPYATRMEMLGADGKALVPEPFIERMKKARALSDPRGEGGVPFHLTAKVELKSGATGSYEETWHSAAKWERRLVIGDAGVSQMCDGGKVTANFEGPASSRVLLQMILNEMDGRFPDRRYQVYEADWGQSVVQFDGKEMVRVARGQVDEKNQPIDGQAFWFDTQGLLHGAFEQATTAEYQDFEEWSGKRVPRRIKVTGKDGVLLTITIEKIEAVGGVTP